MLCLLMLGLQEHAATLGLLKWVLANQTKISILAWQAFLHTGQPGKGNLS